MLHCGDVRWRGWFTIVQTLLTRQGRGNSCDRVQGHAIVQRTILRWGSMFCIPFSRTGLHRAELGSFMMVILCYLQCSQTKPISCTAAAAWVVSSLCSSSRHFCYRQECAGCPVEGKVNKEIVDFAVSQLLGKYKKCFYITVDNFQSQVTT